MICLTVVYPFLLYTPNAFVTRWREWYIETAMGTMTHQWLATWFIPHDIIEEVMVKRYLLNQKMCIRDRAMTTLFQILMGEIKPDEGSFKWGVTTSQSYFPKDNNDFFEGHEENNER